MNNCKNCNISFEPSRNSIGIYCSNKCQMDYQYKQNIENWKQGLIVGYTGKGKSICNWLRRYLFNTRGTACSKCGWDEKHPIDNLPLTEINHIDGNAENNSEDNLEILCPNCHSMTPNFRARNKSSKRIR